MSIANFSSLATTPEGVAQDFAQHMMRSYQEQDNAPAGLGVNRPMFDRPIRNAEDIFAAFDGAFAQQRVTQGGRAMDTPMTATGDTYEGRRNNRLRQEEGVRYAAYDDKTGRPVQPGQPLVGKATVGVGFNMDQPDGRKLWTEAFRGNGPDFDKVRSGEVRLNDGQVDTLLSHMANRTEDYINRFFPGVPLRDHQRQALVSLGYYGPALLRGVAEAYRTGGPQAAAEVIRRGDGKSLVSTRRAREAQLFAGI